MRKKRNFSIAGCLILIAVIAVIAVVGGLFYYRQNLKAVSTEDQEVIVEIPGNSTGNQVLQILEDNGLLRDMRVAKIYLKLHDCSLKSNTYILNKNMDLEEILSILSMGDSEYVLKNKLTVLDGWTIPEYAQAVAKSVGFTQQEVLDVWSDQDYLKKLIEKYWFLTEDILDEDIYYPLEGYLAPETYIFSSDAVSIETVTEVMLDQTEANLEPYRQEISSFAVNGETLSVHEFMTLASIVQRESPANHEDRREIAGVFVHRLGLPMKLQSDVTVNYGNQVTKIDVNASDLGKNTPYNTYRIDGLPVGPISSISGDVFEDVLNYHDTDNLYFFATEDGEVLYAKTYSQHQKNVSENKWY